MCHWNQLTIAILLRTWIWILRSLIYKKFYTCGLNHHNIISIDISYHENITPCPKWIRLWDTSLSSSWPWGGVYFSTHTCLTLCFLSSDGVDAVYPHPGCSQSVCCLSLCTERSCVVSPTWVLNWESHMAHLNTSVGSEISVNIYTIMKIRSLKPLLEAYF